MPTGHFTPTPQYGPNGETWTGRGRKPLWLKNLGRRGRPPGVQSIPINAVKVKGASKTLDPYTMTLRDFAQGRKKPAFYDEILVNFRQMMSRKGYKLTLQELAQGMVCSLSYAHNCVTKKVNVYHSNRSDYRTISMSAKTGRNRGDYKVA